MYLLWTRRREGSEKVWQIIRGLGERNPQQVAVAEKGAKRVFVSQGETCLNCKLRFHTQDLRQS